MASFFGYFKAHRATARCAPLRSTFVG